MHDREALTCMQHTLATGSACNKGSGIDVHISQYCCTGLVMVMSPTLNSIALGNPNTINVI